MKPETTPKDLNTTIARQVRTLWADYAVFLAATLSLAGCYELSFAAEGTLTGHTGTEYVLETIGVLLTMGLVPLALKLFPLILPRYEGEPVRFKLRLHRRASRLRLLLLAVPTWLNLWLYYATLNNIGGLCALIGVTASFFCLPGRERLKDELLIDNDKA